MTTLAARSPQIRLTRTASEALASARAAVRSMPRLIRVSFLLLLAVLALYVAQLAFDIVANPAAEAIEGATGNVGMLGGGVLCAARAIGFARERLVWALLAGGLLAWGVGDLYYTLAFWGMEDAPFPSLADVGYIAFYPLVYAGLVVLLRERLPRVDRLLWIDGLVAALAAAALGAAVLFGVVLEASEGPPATVATNLAYPLGDLVLLSLVVGTFAATGRASLAAWGWIAAGLVIFSVSDALFLLATAEGGYVHGALFDAGWNAAAALLALAAWWPAARAVRTPQDEGWRSIALPIGFGVMAIGLLVFDHWSPTNLLALGLSAAALLAVLARLVVTFSDNVRMLRTSREEALTDSLTGLSNRRQLLADLAETLGEASAARRVALALFDLDGFKQYNDTFGHPAGDALLARLGRKLAAAVAARGPAYRMGGDEFCVLVSIEDDAALRSIDAARAALSERGESFELTCSHGTVLLPEETTDPAEALRLADQRMYRQKYARRGSASRGTTDALLCALAERHPDLDSHVHDVGALAEATARRLGVPEDELERIRLAGELHDIGKVAVPDEILDKPGPLNEREWEFIRRHTLIGARIVAAAPAMVSVARVVRSSHERYDGGGYPEGLAGEEIPLGARIVFACDAFHAMVAGRPYRASCTVEEALAELGRCSGTQFDPAVVEALRDVAPAVGPSGAADATASGCSSGAQAPTSLSGPAETAAAGAGQDA